ncbi:hypothetical protein C8R46DRAFT_580795 [Mycena filopes]|nr:hypothetical protein C8R46DRAFT_580795 [Mycena filopes]
MPPTVINFLRKLFCLCYQQIAPTSRPMLISRRRPGLHSVEGTSSSAPLKGSIKNHLDPASHSLESFASITLTNHPRHPLYELLIRWTPSPPSSPAPLRTSLPPLPSNPHRQRSRTCLNSTPSTTTEAPDPPDRALSHERRIYICLPSTQHRCSAIASSWHLSHLTTIVYHHNHASSIHTHDEDDDLASSRSRLLSILLHSARPPNARGLFTLYCPQ